MSLAASTPVLRYDGTIVQVQEIRAGDLLMGPDSRPRRVLAVASRLGELLSIEPVKGDPWICSADHELTVVHTETGSVEDVSLKRWSAESKWFRHCRKQLFVGVEYAIATEPLPLDPYFIGLWIGDGTKQVDHLGLTKVAVTKPDPEIEQYMREMAERWGLYLRCDDGGGNRCTTWIITGGLTREERRPNLLLFKLREVMGMSLDVPHVYLTANRAERLQMLAGWVDSDGYLHNGVIEVAQKRVSHADALIRLARSLGFCACRTVKFVNGDPYQRVSFSGHIDQIPNKLARKHASPRKQIKDVTRCGFIVHPAGQGDCVDLVLDGDGRHLLSDFTVTKARVL